MDELNNIGIGGEVTPGGQGGALSALRRGGQALVTGAAGHFGANLTRRLLAEGVAVRALLRRGSDNRAMDGLDVERVYGDLRDPDSLQPAVRGISHVFHAAAKVSTVSGGEREIYECNVLGTRNLLRAARTAGCGRVVVTGSLSAVGVPHDDPRRPVHEDDPFYPFEEHMPYEFTKTFMEHECWAAAAAGQDVLVAISTAILGPHDYKPSRMGRVLLDFANGRLRAYLPGGFDFVSAADLAEGHLLAMERGRAGQRYILSTGFLTIDDLLDTYAEVSGVPRHGLRLPPPLMAGIARASGLVLDRLPGVQRRFTPRAVRLLRMQRRADTSKAREELGYRPTSLRTAIHDAFTDFARRGLVDPRGRRSLWTRLCRGPRLAPAAMDGAPASGLPRPTSAALAPETYR